jgi:hypothetical protein
MHGIDVGSVICVRSGEDIGAESATRMRSGEGIRAGQSPACAVERAAETADATAAEICAEVADNVDDDALSTAAETTEGSAKRSTLMLPSVAMMRCDAPT